MGALLALVSKCILLLFSRSVSDFPTLITDLGRYQDDQNDERRGAC